jgi:NAD-dependent deacetylase
MERAMGQIIDDVVVAAEALTMLVKEASRVVGFTGAGISTECGVPDFRSPGSPWMVNKPIPFDAFVASAEARKEAWRRKFNMDDSFAGSQPGRGHAALAALHHAGKMPVLITQNIDGLHHDSGLPADAVIELHGNGTYATCLDCGERHELEEIRAHFEVHGHPPPCRSCAGLIKSATISFGQTMPQAAMRRATEATMAADVFLAIGSSLVVFPAADFPVAAKRNGARLVIVNREPTGADTIADLVIRADIGSVLSLMQQKLQL